MASKTAAFRVAIRRDRRRTLPNTPDGHLLDLIETDKAHIRAKVEHPFQVVKHQFGFQKTSLPGLAKNRRKIDVPAPLTNLLMARGKLITTACARNGTP